MFYSFAHTSAAYNGPTLLGGKGHSLHTMKSIGMPVPPGFVIATGACKSYQADPDFTMKSIMIGCKEDVLQLIAPGEVDLPLLSIRSGAPVSMPGMMDTILNVGLTTKTLPVWAEKLGKRAALDCYRRLIQMMGSTAYGVPADAFEEILTKAKANAGVTDDKFLSEEMLEDVIVAFAAIFKLHTGENFPDTVDGQLRAAIEAVFKSWMNPRAIKYRALNKISDEIGTAIVVQAMVFGNMNDNSGSGVLFSRDPSTGAKELVGEFLANAQGEDVVAGVRTPLQFSAMREMWPDVAAELASICVDLEAHYRDMVDIEFTVQDGKLYMLQCRPGKRAAKAGVEIAYAMYQEKRIGWEELRQRIKKIDLEKVTLRQVDPDFAEPPRYIGIGATSGVVTGMCALTAEEAETAAEPTILVRLETDPDDIGGMSAAVGILTRTGGQTSHAAVVARGMNKACIVGCTDLPENLEALAGHRITLDASTGRVWVDSDVPLIGGEANTTLQLIAARATVEGLDYAIPMDGKAISPGSWVLDLSGEASLNNETKAAIATLLIQHPESLLTVDCRPRSCPEDAQLEALWGQPEVSAETAFLRLSDLAEYLPAGVRTKVLVAGDQDIVGRAESLGFATPKVSKSLEEALDTGNLCLSAAVEKALGGGVVAQKLRTALAKAGFVNKAATRIAPWQYVFQKWVNG